jgi:hypothetical protein
MLRVTHHMEVPGPTKSMGDIPVGTLFYASIGSYGKSLYLKIFNGIVDLVNPCRTWCDRPILNEPVILDYHEVNGELIVQDDGVSNET